MTILLLQPCVYYTLIKVFYWYLYAYENVLSIFHDFTLHVLQLQFQVQTCSTYLYTNCIIALRVFFVKFKKTTIIALHKHTLQLSNHSVLRVWFPYTMIGSRTKVKNKHYKRLSAHRQRSKRDISAFN